MDNNECMLTTFDNPFNPFEQFVQWRLFDIEYLARIAKFSDDMSQKEIDLENERAIDEIIKVDPLNIYKKVWRQPITAQ